MTCSLLLCVVIHVPGLPWPLLLVGLVGLVVRGFASLDGDFSEAEDIEVIEKKLEELLHLEAKIKADYSRGLITEERYQKSMTRLLEVRQELQSRLEDSIVAMISPEKAAPQPPAAVSDPLAYTARQSNQADKESAWEDKEPLIKVTNVKRGIINGVRGLEVKFLFHENPGKAVIDSEDGYWHFSSMPETLYLGQFISGLQKSLRFAEVFEKEVSRHPDDWHEVIVEGKSYAKGGKEKNSRYNFPPICHEIIAQYSILTSEKSSHKTKAGFVDLTGEPVVISKVECGQYNKVQRKDFGKGFLEFPRYILITLDWGKYHLKAEITTDTAQWEVTPRDPSHDYPPDLLPKFIQVIPFMMQELDQPRNKYLAHAILSEMRRSEERHQWKPIVTRSAAFAWPQECCQLFPPDSD